jgi:hypothetical protein
MKKLVILALAIVALVAASSAFAATNYEQQAIRAAKDAGCIAQNENGTIVVVETVSSCFVSGFINVAHVYVDPIANCHDTPNRPCPRPAITLQADVTFDCADQVTSVVCY